MAFRTGIEIAKNSLISSTFCNFFFWADSSVFFLLQQSFPFVGQSLLYFKAIFSSRQTCQISPIATFCCVSKTFLFSGRTAPSSCLRTNSVGQVAFPCENLLKILLCRQFSCRSFFPLSLFSPSRARFDNVKIVPYDTPIQCVLQSSAWSSYSARP